MNKLLKQFAVVAAVVAISMVFILEFRPGTNMGQAGGSGPRCVVEVSGECIPYTDYKTAYRLAAPQVDKEVLQQLRMRQIIVEGLIERWLLLEDAKRLGVTASDKDVKNYIAEKSIARFSIPASQEVDFWRKINRITPRYIPGPLGPGKVIEVFDPKTKKFEYKRYTRWVQRFSGKTEKAFIEFQKAEVIAARMRHLVRSRVRVSEAEAFARYGRENEKLVVDYVSVERAYYKDHALDHSDEAITKWANAHTKEIEDAWEKKKEGYKDGCRQARHILKRLDESATDKKAEKKRITEELAKIKKRLEGEEAESFSDVAREVSEDQSTAKDGGDLGCFGAGKIAKGAAGKKIDDAAQKLEAGKVSDVIESDHGLHLVVVEKINNAEEAEKIGRAVITREMYDGKESERMASEGAKQIHASVKDGKTLQEALDTHLLSVLKGDAKAAYEKGKAGDDDDDDDEGDDDEGDDDDDKKKDDKDKKDGDKKDKDGDKDKGDDDDAEKSSGYTAWTDPNRPEVKTSDPFTRTAPPFPRVQQPADAASRLFKLEKAGDVPEDVIKLYEGYAVAQLKERQAVEKKKWDEERHTYMANLKHQKQTDALIAYVKRLRDTHAKEVTYNISLDESKDTGEENEG